MIPNLFTGLWTGFTVLFIATSCRALCRATSLYQTLLHEGGGCSDARKEEGGLVDEGCYDAVAQAPARVSQGKTWGAGHP